MIGERERLIPGKNHPWMLSLTKYRNSSNTFNKVDDKWFNNASTFVAIVIEKELDYYIMFRVAKYVT